MSSNSAAPTATVVWSDLDSSGNYSIRGQQWSLDSDSPTGTSRVLSATGESVSNAPVAVAASGSEATIVWSDASPNYAIAQTVRALRWPIGGMPGTEVTPSAADDVHAGALTVGADSGGDSVIAWTTTPPNDGKTADVLRAAQRPSGSTSVGTPKLISGANDNSVGGVALSVTAGGGAIIAWGATHGCALASCSSPPPTFDLREVSLSSSGNLGTEKALAPAQSADVDPMVGTVESVIDGSGVTTVVFATQGPVPELFGVRIAASGSPGTVHPLTKLFTDYGGFTLGVTPGGAVTGVWLHPLPCNSTVRSATETGLGSAAQPAVDPQIRPVMNCAAGDRR